MHGAIKQDALLRRELLGMRPKEGSYDATKYSTLCVDHDMDTADTTYEVAVDFAKQHIFGAIMQTQELYNSCQTSAKLKCSPLKSQKLHKLHWLVHLSKVLLAVHHRSMFCNHRSGKFWAAV